MSYLKKTNTKLIKESKIFCKQPNTVVNPNIVDIKSVVIEHLETSHNLFKAIRRVEKVSKVSGTSKTSDGPLSSETKQVKNFRIKKIKK